MLLDSHCHLTHRKFAEEGIRVDDLLADFTDANVLGCMNVCCRIRNEFHDDILPSTAHSNVWCTVGTHPHEASDPDELAFTADQITELSQHEKVVGIGECGLDYYYDFAKVEDQHTVFRKHIQVCLATGLPIIIHARDADEDIIRIIRDEDPQQKLTGIMHSFSSGAELAQQALDHGLHLSFSGMVTFKKSEELRAIAARTPLNRLLVETDAPYLAPVPMRGRTNRPAYVAHTAQCMAQIFDLTTDEVAKITTDNYFNLFKKAVRPDHVSS